MIEENYGGKPPLGFSNRPKTLEVLGFMERGGFSDKEAVKVKFQNMLVQARQAVKMPGVSDLDRVWLAIKGGSIR